MELSKIFSGLFSEWLNFYFFTFFRLLVVTSYNFSYVMVKRFLKALFVPCVVDVSRRYSSRSGKI